MKKPNALQAALSKSASPAAALDLEKPPRAAASASRDGLVNVSSWQPPQFKQNLLLLKAYGKGDVQTLMAEALNDLFAKYDLPHVHPTTTGRGGA